jgi:hemoglobin-like flavoprotein
VKGEMLARVFEMVLDFIDHRSYAGHMVQCEVVTHDSYGVPPEVFPQFFDVVAKVLEEAAGSEWTPEMTKAWGELLAELRWLSTHPDQTAALG